MQLHLRFAIVIIFILVHFPVSLCADDGKFAACSRNFQCGNLGSISYPFWGLDRPKDCGYPGFQLDCQGEATLISIATNNFRVLRIDNRTKTLTVARTDYWNNSCPMSLRNTTMDPNLFSYVSDVQFLTLFYNCPAINPEGKCNNSVRVPVFQSAAVAIGENSTTLAQALDGGFGLQWNANNSLCDGCVASGGRCGHIPSSGEFSCYCNNGSSRSTCKSTPGTSEPTPTAKPGSFFKRHKWIKIAIGIVAGIIVVSIIVICSLRRKYLSSKAMAFWKKETKNDHEVKAFMRNHGYAPKLYKYSEVKKITNSFADELGKGGFGVVYKGRLSDGRLVAVKVLSQSKGNGEDFINEVASISRTSHINVVSLLGFCHERTKRALVYEFMPNGSLDKFIYHHGPSNENRHLEWNTLYQIAVGIGRGLEYLHRGCNTRILHFDIKPHNILLDENFCPKISDFGLAKLCRNGESTVSMQNGRGTPGYVAPELTCRNLGKVSYKSDVYSYGMMVLEMVGGRKNIDVGVSRNSAIYFPQWIHNHIEQGQDLGLGGVVTEEEEEIARKMILVGLQCIQTIPSDGPSMTEVIEKLEGSLQSLEIPPRPVPSSSARPPRHSSTTSSS